MTLSDDENESLAQFLESEILSEVSDQEEACPEVPKGKRLCVDKPCSSKPNEDKSLSLRLNTGNFSNIPTDLFRNIFKFLSSEDLIACSMVCRFMNFAVSDECLWRRLYCMRWGPLPTSRKLRESSWKKLYIQRDKEDIAKFVRTCPTEFKEYYIQMQAAKRSEAPLASQVNDDRIVLDKTVADQVNIWKTSKGLPEMVVDHACSGDTCTYFQIGDAFICEKTGQVHVCDDACREVILDPSSELLVCTISGHCFDRLLSPGESDLDAEQQQACGADEAEPFMGSGRFARAYELGYNCADEKELEATLRFC
uniref:F-box domain-containing protein n=1 Tax=Kalanchoe fedtschenkoi TaxID=63787 RepID=A0A7N0UI03_KALFE